jgi:NAD(P)H-flavin reductase
MRLIVCKKHAWDNINFLRIRVIRKSSSGSNAQGKEIVTIRILYTPVGLVSRYINGNSLDEFRIPKS